MSSEQLPSDQKPSGGLAWPLRRLVDIMDDVAHGGVWRQALEVAVAAFGLALGSAHVREVSALTRWNQELVWSSALVTEVSLFFCVSLLSGILIEAPKRKLLILICLPVACLAALYGALQAISSVAASAEPDLNLRLLTYLPGVVYHFASWLMISALLFFIVERLVAIKQDSQRLPVWSAAAGAAIGLLLSQFTALDAEWSLWQTLMPFGHAPVRLEMLSIKEGPLVWDPEVELTNDRNSLAIEKWKKQPFKGSQLEKLLQNLSRDRPLAIGILIDKLPPDWEPAIAAFDKVIVGLPSTQAALDHHPQLRYSCSVLPLQNQRSTRLPDGCIELSTPAGHVKHVPSFIHRLQRTAYFPKLDGDSFGNECEPGYAYVRDLDNVRIQYKGLPDNVRSLQACADGTLPAKLFANKIVIVDLLGTHGKLYYPLVPSYFEMARPYCPDYWLQGAALNTIVQSNQTRTFAPGPLLLSLLAAGWGLACCAWPTRRLVTMTLVAVIVLFTCSILLFQLVHLDVPCVLAGAACVGTASVVVLLRLDARSRWQAQQLYAAQSVLAAQDEDRRRIAADLHDTLKPALGEIGRLSWALADKGEDEIANKISDSVRQSKERVDAIVRDLYPDELRHGLAVALELSLDRFAGRTGFQTTFDNTTGKDDFGLSATANRQLLAMCEELLQNTEKHAKMATLARIKISRQDNSLLLEIGDDDPNLPTNTGDGFGGRTLAFRASAIGATTVWHKTVAGKHLQIAVQIAPPAIEESAES